MKLTRSEAMKLRHAVARLDGWLEVATPEDLTLGMKWYATAHAIALELAYLPGALTVRQTAGVIAALSPRCQWGANVAGARAMVRAAAMGQPEPRVAGTLGNRAKAWAIANGADPDAVLSGPKVRAFWANICGDVETVTVDAWAAEACEGRRLPSAPARRRYQLCAEAYRRAARRRGMTPRDAQAAVWTVYRRRFGYAYDPH